MVISTRYTCPAWPFGTFAPLNSSGMPHMASDKAQNRWRQTIISPMATCTPRKSLAPVISRAFMNNPVMKSNFTASLVQP